MDDGDAIGVSGRSAGAGWRYTPPRTTLRPPQPVKQKRGLGAQDVRGKAPSALRGLRPAPPEAAPASAEPRLPKELGNCFALFVLHVVVSIKN